MVSQEILDLAVKYGVDQDNDVLFSFSTKNVVAVTYEEPTKHILPLDCVWIRAKPNDPNKGKAYKRVNRTPSGGLQNTWRLAENDVDIMADQTWDQSPLPVIISGAGGTLDGRIFSTPENQTPTKANEFSTKYWVDYQRTDLSRGFYVMFNNMNARVLYLEDKVSELSQEINGLKTNVTKQFEQKTASKTWVLRHGLGQGKGIVTCLTNEGRYVWADKVEQGEDTNFYLTFCAPVSGTAYLTFIPQK